MALHTPIFLFFFLPVFLVFYAVAGLRYRNSILLVFSLGFFAWNDPFYFPVMLGLLLVNWFFLKSLVKNSEKDGVGRRVMATGIAINLLGLLLFKFLAAYSAPILEFMAVRGALIPGWLTFIAPNVAHLPLGISFFSFQAISMLIDARRGSGDDQVGVPSIANYLLMFPRIIAGPIVRFKGILKQIRDREFSIQNLESGISRFIIGFAKKTLIADQLALITDRGIFSEPPSHIPIGVAWLAVSAFALQIYFDFSGYTDMAIGIGRMLGFEFPDNFNDPYISRSITEFWRRWHITLSNWFRDYVFFPLERKRREVPFLNQSLNILIVFILTGLWHGLSWPYVIWGFMHGVALALERGRFGDWLQKIWKPFQHVYTLSVILLGWVIFLSPTLTYAWKLLKVLLGIMPSNRQIPFSVFPPIANLTWMALIAGVILSILPGPVIRNVSSGLFVDHENTKKFVPNIILILLFLAAIIVRAGSSYAPFIYGEF